MLDTLAVVGHSDGGGLSRAHDVLRGGNEGLLIAFFGDLDEEQTAVAARMRQRAGAGVAFVLDSAAWAGDGSAAGAAEDRLRRLRESGWTAVPVEPGDELPELWQLAGGMRTDTPSAPSGGPNGFAGGWS
ncbi:membrane protein [Streptomyces badius]